MAPIYNDLTETVGNTPLVRLNRTAKNHGALADKQIVAISPPSSERYLSSWLFNDISIESDTLDLDYLGASPVSAQSQVTHSHSDL